MEETHQKITKWLTEIFRKSNFDTFELKFPDYDKNGGYAGEIEFADVIAEKEGIQQKIKLIIKKNKNSEILMNTLNMRVIYANEVNFYSKIIPMFARFAEEKNTAPFEAIPLCYGTVNEQDQYVIVLENLKPKGYRLHELNEYLDLGHVKLVLEAYGKWHALNLAFRDQNRQVFDTLATEQSDNKMLEIFKNTVKHEIGETIELFRDRNRQHLIENLENLKKNYDQMVLDAISTENEEHVVIKHGDSWNNNYLFHYNEEKNNPDKVVIIDWQLSFFSSPLFDVTNVIFGCCSRNELKHVDDLLKFYYNTLSKKLRELGSDPERVFPWKNCLKLFERFAPISIAVIPLQMRMRYRVDSDTQFDIENAVGDGVFSGCHGEGVRDPEKYFEEIYGLFEYIIERKWI